MKTLYRYKAFFESLIPDENDTQMVLPAIVEPVAPVQQEKPKIVGSYLESLKAKKD